MALSFRRIERKFLLNQEQYQMVLHAFNDHLEKDKYTNGNKYHVYNIYYDTDDDQLIRHSLDKPWFKEKLRLRSYTMPLTDESLVYLELKKKIDGIVTKRRVGLTYLEAKNLLEKNIVPFKDTYLERQIMKEIVYFLSCHHIAPRVFLHYERLAFYDPSCPSFRATLDNHLCARRDHLEFIAGDDYYIIPPDDYLMEIKSINNYPVWFIKLLEQLSIQRTSFSKYGKEYENHICERSLIYV